MKHIALITFIAFITGCNGSKNQTNIELIQNMMDQVSIKSQDWDPKNPGQVQMRCPPEHTVSRGHTPYKYAKDPSVQRRTLIRSLETCRPKC